MKKGGVWPPWRKSVMMLRNRPLPRLLMLLALAMSATGCVPAQTRWLAPQSPEIPPLPKEARQEALPSICSPTCSAALSIELKRLRALQTVPASQGWLASDTGSTSALPRGGDAAVFH